MRAPIACAHRCVPPGTVHVDERHRWLRSMQRHDPAAKRGGLQQRGIVKLLAEAPALVGWRDCELPERPGLWLSQKLNFGCGIRPGQRYGCHDLATKLADEADAACDAFLGVGHRLVCCPVPQTACSVRRISRVNELSQRVQIIRCRNAPYVQVLGHVAVPSNVKLRGVPLTDSERSPKAWIFTKLQNRHETARPFERHVRHLILLCPQLFWKIGIAVSIMILARDIHEARAIAADGRVVREVFGGMTPCAPLISTGADLH